ncbi:MAG: DUF4911 domain-containing protein [Desulfobulbaceae bacterium]|nr:DUF4911 domain-containing protein [Desulfobulbaceae bacterium]
MNIVFLFLHVMPAKIWYLKFLLEGYDGLALLTTIDRNKGLVRLAVPRPRYTEVMLLLENLAGELANRDNVFC